MAEYIVELDKNHTFKMPTDLVNKMDLTQGDNLILRINDGVIEMQKLAMTMAKNAEHINDAIGETYKIERN